MPRYLVERVFHVSEDKMPDVGRRSKEVAVNHFPEITWEHSHVVVDETPIGNFGEIEGPPRWIDATARRLGIQRSDYITLNYAGLFQQWKQRTGSPATEMTFKAARRRRSRTKG